VVGDDRDPYWAVECFSYLLCPSGRRDTWTGKTAGEAIGKAEDGVRDWCLSSEMEMFEKAMGAAPDDEEDDPAAEANASVSDSDLPF